jgi:hypothetical protein
LTENSPYAEVRAVVSNKDDVSSPAGTIRAWTIGLLFVVLLSFVNQLFSVRQPAIRVEGAVVQLLSFPLGKAWERWLPVGEFSLFGQTLKLNPGKFNQKEHMLISIMANVASALPHSRYIIFTTWMERYFNMPFASSFGFQVCVSVSAASYKLIPRVVLMCTAFYELDGVRSCWTGSTIPGIPVILHLAPFAGHCGAQPVSS